MSLGQKAIKNLFLFTINRIYTIAVSEFLTTEDNDKGDKNDANNLS